MKLTKQNSIVKQPTISRADLAKLAGSREKLAGFPDEPKINRRLENHRFLWHVTFGKHFDKVVVDHAYLSALIRRRCLN